MVQLSKAKFRTIPMKTALTEDGKSLDFQYDWDAFEDALGPKTKIVLLTNPHNPTGK